MRAATTPTLLARAAYHLGNRHVPVQIGDGFVALRGRSRARDMVRGLGARVTSTRAPFEPEAGAYAAGAAHARGDGHHAAVIHDHRPERAMSAATRARSADASDGVLPLVRLLQLASARRCRSAPTAIRRGSSATIDSRRRPRRADARSGGSATCSNTSSPTARRPVLWRLLAASECCDPQRFRHWSAWLRASRESRELRAETEQMGASLAQARDRPRHPR